MCDWSVDTPLNCDDDSRVGHAPARTHPSVRWSGRRSRRSRAGLEYVQVTLEVESLVSKKLAATCGTRGWSLGTPWMMDTKSSRQTGTSSLRKCPAPILTRSSGCNRLTWELGRLMLVSHICPSATRGLPSSWVRRVQLTRVDEGRLRGTCGRAWICRASGRHASTSGTLGTGFPLPVSQTFASACWRSLGVGQRPELRPSVLASGSRTGPG